MGTKPWDNAHLKKLSGHGVAQFQAHSVMEVILILLPSLEAGRALSRRDFCGVGSLRKTHIPRFAMRPSGSDPNLI